MTTTRGSNRGKAGFRFLASLALTFLLVSSASTLYSQSGGTTFSGTWTINETKSPAPEGGFRFGATMMVITQDANNLSIESTRKNQNGEDVKSTSKFTLDGKECTNPAGFGNSTRKSLVTRAADGKSLNFAHTMKFDRDGETQEFKSAEVWKINDSDKTLVVETTMNFNGEERKTTVVYDKK